MVLLPGFIQREKSLGVVVVFLFFLYQKGERCLCHAGFLGHSCQLSLHDDSGAGQWWRIKERDPYMSPRTGSAGVYLSSTGAMYVFGGENRICVNFSALHFLGVVLKQQCDCFNLLS